ncbi:DUF6241 domain-containing protein [Bacillus sp. USDA818B3_A]|uniref:DUF6241 domain-containing protein n=1 Tax=Bacillus sp. USDA818B3_A TaxID=2698834 RepID=UPI00136EE83C|nr:DUF6241 domain-containing protein [Bacillus sp. USDA818B3_A]
MKKTLFYACVGFVILIGGTYAVLSSNGEKKEAAITDKQETTTSKKVATKQVPTISQAELDKAAKNFDEIESNVKGDDIFYYGMITMAIQKLEFKGEENYRLPNTPESIKRIQFNRANLQYLKNKAVELRASKPYQTTLDKWLKGDFSNFENDYLTIRDIKGDPTKPSESPVQKIRTVEEEQKYIKHFFGDEGLQMNKRDWQ